MSSWEFGTVMAGIRDSGSVLVSSQPITFQLEASEKSQCPYMEVVMIMLQLLSNSVGETVDRVSILLENLPWSPLPW